MPVIFVGSAAAGTPYLVGDQMRGKGVVCAVTVDASGVCTGGGFDENRAFKVGSNPTAIIAFAGGLIVSDETYGDDTNSSVWSTSLEGHGQCQVDAGGRACCHLALHPSGALVAAANYLGEAPAIDPANQGTLSIFRVSETGIGERTAHIPHSTVYPGANAARQEAAHIHSTAWAQMDADGKSALLVCDLGSDKVWQYIVDDSSGVVESNPVADSVGAHAAGAGPRHITMHPSGTYAYIICEMGSTVQGHTFDAATGTLSADPICAISTITPGDEKAGDDSYSTCAGLKMHPTGKFLYGSNRGHDSIVVFAIDPTNGTLTWVANEMTGGKKDASGGPRDFALSPCGSFLAVGNQDTDTVATYAIDSETGKLTKASEVDFPAPVSLLIQP